MTVDLCPFADENIFATSAEPAPTAKKHFGSQNCITKLHAARKIFVYKQSGMFYKRKTYEKSVECFYEPQEKINGERFFFSLAHLIYKEG